MINPVHLIEPILELASRAGEAILSIYMDDDRMGEVMLKQDQSPLTAADRTSNELLVNGLRELTPDIPVLSEESAVQPYEIRKGWEYFWCVDPLDGTKEFLQKNGEFCICIALIHDRRPILGIIHIPVSGSSYYGSMATGAWKITKDQAPVRLYADNRATDWIAVSSRSHRSPEETKMAGSLPITRHIFAGSALKFCLIAEGSAHFYLRQGSTMEWDTAAGQVLVEISGGKLCTLSGQPLLYNKESLVNESFMCGIAQAIQF
jgi:3'(2'), 5'-bisphosphate nucleotidase